jgi:riboflavin biosynthesis pyrimidine reductase
MTLMVDLPPIETLFESASGIRIPLPETLARLYGELSLPRSPDRPYVISNFVSTIDGVVTLGVSGKAGGNAISGSNQHDAMVMGLLRSVSDAVIVGAGNVAASPKHIWTAERVFPRFTKEYVEIRSRLNLADQPLNIIVSASINLDLSLPIFQSGKVEVLIVTTESGFRKITKERLPTWVHADAAGAGPMLTTREILDAVLRFRPRASTILVEGGPHLMGTFFGDEMVDELFLTLAPQIAGRGDSPGRLGLVAQRLLAPGQPVWGRVVSIKRAANHLFLRYAFSRQG